MKHNISVKERLGREKKVRTSLMITETTMNRINKYKEQNEIITLSPFIELMINDWLDDQEKQEHSNKIKGDTS